MKFEAIVAIGGRGSRLKASSPRDSQLDFVTKSFVPFAGRPALFWTLRSLMLAGVGSVLLVGSGEGELRLAKALCPDGRFGSMAIGVFRDAGLGVHGIPWHVREWLEEHVLFEAGHSIGDPAHYLTLRRLAPGDVASSAVPVRGSHVAPGRTLVRGRLQNGWLRPDWGMRDCIATLPMRIDRAYISLLPRNKFAIELQLADPLVASRLRLVALDISPEFDDWQDYLVARRTFAARVVGSEAIIGSNAVWEVDERCTGEPNPLPVEGAPHV